jgi:hypothetical protein
MNTEVKTLLSRAVDEGPPIDSLMDPGADLRRARHDLKRRRTTLFGGVAATVLVAGLVAAAGLNAHAGPPAVPAAAPAAVAPQSIALVSYTGKQAAAFKIAWVPSGWTVVESDGLVSIAPDKGADPDPLMADDKITVSALSDDIDPSEWTGLPKFKINGRDGYLRGPMLAFKAATGRWIDVQLPEALSHWTPAQLRKFAEGITVSKNLGHSGG